MTFQGELPKPSLVQNLLDDLMKAIKSEGQVFKETYEQLKHLATDFLHLPLADVLKRLAGILTEAALGTAQVVVDALLNVIYHVASFAVDFFDTKIHIPVISDILNAIGVPDLSFLDLITRIAGLGVTVVYKLANNNTAPFPDDATSRALVATKDWTEFHVILNPSTLPFTTMAMTANTNTHATTKPAPTTHLMAAKSPIPLNASAQKAIYTSGHAIAGFIAFTGNFLFFAEAMDESPDNAFGLPSAIMGVIGAIAAAGADTLVAQMPLQYEAVAWVRRGTTGFTVASKILFSGFVQSGLDSTGLLGFLKADDNRKVGAVVNSFLMLPALACTCYHFYELAEREEGRERSCAIIWETASMVS